ncbi:MAG: histidine triad nucleotide-binding protein [Betaproteobacteria bacterium]|nr:histidine triad nucleotide-binding protein [Betaproteobacteria bacterium]MCL2887139.1 histidine triad nucleotide-binding protein [Betaproteobacteria bacterium]
MSDCLFCRIVAGAIPSQKVYEDEEMLAFRDISPLRPVHVLIIPKKHIASLSSATAEDAPLLGRMLARANAIALAEGSPDGFRVIINNGRVGQQEVPHLHIHVIGGPEALGPMLTRI